MLNLAYPRSVQGEIGHAELQAQLGSKHSAAKPLRGFGGGGVKRMGIDQPKISALLNGRLRGFSTDRLITFLNALGRDVIITIKPAKTKKHGKVQVAAMA